ncbi:MAG: septation protein SpoVG family protein [Planctomycetaceae bacterium]|nr:septation protein SpoVG family protein [Planctomycetaceae bacterium]
MNITEIRIKLMSDPNDRLQAFCSITFDYCFVIRDLKIIQGTKGPFVAMPSRKLTDRCPKCEMKNHLRAAYCNGCGTSLDSDRALDEDDGRAKLYADIAHPINSDCREMIQDQVVAAFEEEMVRAKEPGYTCRYDDYGEENYARLKETESNPDILPMSAHQPDEDSAQRRVDGAHEEKQDPHAGEQRRPQQEIFYDNEGDSFGAGVL